MTAITLRELEYVVAVVERQNFTAAARELHMTQPSLSQAIQRIERRLGVRLFERSSRQVVPTSGAEVLVSEGYAILDHVERAVSLAREASPRRLRIYAVAPALELPRRLVSAIRTGCPTIAIRHGLSRPSDVIQRLRMHGPALAIGGPLRESDIATEPVGSESVGVVISPATRPERAVSISPAELATMPVISIDEEATDWNVWIDRLLSRYGLRPRWSESSGLGADACRDMVVEGLGVLVCPESLGHQIVSASFDDGIRWLPLDPVQTARWFVSYRRTDASHPVMEETLRVTRAFAREGRPDRYLIPRR